WRRRPHRSGRRPGWRHPSTGSRSWRASPLERVASRAASVARARAVPEAVGQCPHATPGVRHLRPMREPDPSTELDRLADARAAYARLRPRVIAGDPWPLAEDFGTGPEASWGPREVLAHVEEMLPYWLREPPRHGGGRAGARPL